MLTKILNIAFQQQAFNVNNGFSISNEGGEEFHEIICNFKVDTTVQRQIRSLKTYH